MRTKSTLLALVVIGKMSVNNRVTCDEAAANINEDFRSLFVEDCNGNTRAPVCSVCDCFILPEEREIVPLKWLLDEDRLRFLRPAAWNCIDSSLRECYKLDLSDMMEDDDPLKVDAVIELVKSLMLSPRSTYVRSMRNRRYSGLTACSSCKMQVQTRERPATSICNNYCMGTPPLCLALLEDAELAYLSPVKEYGYCFSYTGGRQRCLEGSLSYFRVKTASIVRAITQLDVLGMTKDVIVVIYGNVTPEQKNKIQKKTTLRVEKVMQAIEWLIAHNTEWKRHENAVDMDLIRRELENTSPIILDNSNCAESDPSNEAEKGESFRVYFPDGSINEETGGQANVERFKEMVRRAKMSGYDLDFQCNFAKESVLDFKDNTLVNACLLQFPYGRGGMHENRMKRDGSMTDKVDVDEYIEHLSRLSPSQFHHDRFALILYNMTMR